jgi:hypothetical protein
MKDGQSLDKEKLTKALGSRGLSLTSMEQEKIARPESAYLLTKTGGT